MIKDLTDYLKKCDEAYYNGTAIISDETYDALLNSLKILDSSNEYLKKVGVSASTLDHKSKLGRLTPMGTLSKFHLNEEVEGWVKKEAGVSGGYMLSDKYDGFGVELIYVGGELVSAGTRGDGYTGENVLESILLLNSVPKKLPSEFSTLKVVRGEAIIPRKNHDEIKKLGYEAMRNAVPGIVRSCNKKALEFVDFVAYEFFDGGDNRLDQREKYSELFIVESFEYFQPNEFDKMLVVRDKLGKEKDSYIYEIDGTVIKTVNIIEDDLLNPVHQIAWKFKSNRRETVLREVVFQMGVTGKFTPVGIFDPVEFQGAQLGRASFGSIYRFKDLAPKIGCVIEVSRRGDIIPYIEEIISTEVPGVIDIEELTHCPYCEEELDPSDFSCINVHCPEKLKLQIGHYVGSLGVKGIGPSLIRGLVENGFITSLQEIYEVKEEDILSIPRQGQGAVDKWNTLVTKNVMLIDFLSALPFDSIGPAVWKTLLANATIEEILHIDSIETFGKVFGDKELKGIGESKVNSFTRQMRLYGNYVRVMFDKVSII